MHVANPFCAGFAVCSVVQSGVMTSQPYWTSIRMRCPGGNPACSSHIPAIRSAGAQCSDATLNAAIQAQGADAAVASENVAIYGTAAVGTAAAVALAPEALAGLALIPGAPIFSSGGALGSAALASANGTGAISAVINAGSQYAQIGKINPVDVAGAYATGAIGSSGGLLWNIDVNTLGGGVATAFDNYFYGQNSGIVSSAITSGVLSGLGYGIGKAAENGASVLIKPGLNSADWASTGVWTGSGWNLFRPNSAAVAIGTLAGGSGQEIAGSAAQNLPQSNGQKK
ncbi:hypothetical protein [Paraburkholderia sejongensis]|uniref:hypothetical protein n=1 Tax=Paraburkholderia sejongensis TaxID=2886946 RepID=UPI001E615D5C|nr:hypothetical protein [Paraburkholderia sp. MMS20-SJTR3]